MDNCKIKLDKDGLPFIWADEKTVLFGYGEDSFELKWAEIYKVCKEYAEAK